MQHQGHGQQIGAASGGEIPLHKPAVPVLQDFPFWEGVLCQGLCDGFGGGLLNVVIGSTVMKTVPREMMGRVSGFLAAVMQASMPAASFICSALALCLSIPQIFILFGGLTLGCYLLLCFGGRLSGLGTQADGTR